MVQSAEVRLGCDLADGLDFARDGGVTVERHVRPRLVVVLDVLGQHSKQVSLTERDYVVSTLAADGPDHALDERVLPR